MAICTEVSEFASSSAESIFAARYQSSERNPSPWVGANTSMTPVLNEYGAETADLRAPKCAVQAEANRA
jgi:hypothetical protein